jgi:phage minor structural protein
MAGAVPALYWFDRFDERIGMLPVLGELVHTEELNGEDTLEFTTSVAPVKGDRLLWLDGSTWREHVVVRIDEPAAGRCEVYAESGLCELLCDFVEETQLVGRTASQALSAVLAPTRWTAGAVSNLGTGSTYLYHLNALAALRRVADVWHGEVSAVISVADGAVCSRAVNLLKAIGGWHGMRLTYGKNMAGCTRTILEEDVYTALYGFGAGLPATDDEGRYTGGYRRKLTFGEVNGGVNWIGDETARLMWGRWNMNRTAKVHSFGQVTFGECTDAAQLLALTRAALAEATRPKVSYEVDAALLDGRDVGLGDEVAVIDTSREPEWRLRARVVRRVRTFAERVVCRVTIGTVQLADYASLSTVAADVVALRDDVAGIDGNLSTATSVAAVNDAVATAIEDLDELDEVGF